MPDVNMHARHALARCAKFYSAAWFRTAHPALGHPRHPACCGSRRGRRMVVDEPPASAGAGRPAYEGAGDDRGGANCTGLPQLPSDDPVHANGVHPGPRLGLPGRARCCRWSGRCVCVWRLALSHRCQGLLGGIRASPGGTALKTGLELLLKAPVVRPHLGGRCCLVCPRATPIPRHGLGTLSPSSPPPPSKTSRRPARTCTPKRCRQGKKSDAADAAAICQSRLSGRC
jgi:hypothetical protein